MKKTGIAKVLARDAAFDKKIKELRPDWFAKASRIHVKFPKGHGKSGTLAA